MPCECTCHLAADPRAERFHRGNCCEHCPICEENVAGFYMAHKKEHTDKLAEALKLLGVDLTQPPPPPVPTKWFIYGENWNAYQKLEEA